MNIDYIENCLSVKNVLSINANDITDIVFLSEPKKKIAQHFDWDINSCNFAP